MIKEDPPKRCVHFYACVCAFASDDKLAEEFAYYINLDNMGKEVSTPLDLSSLDSRYPTQPQLMYSCPTALSPTNLFTICVSFCAFASDDKLADEFACYINLDNRGKAYNHPS